MCMHDKYGYQAREIRIHKTLHLDFIGVLFDSGASNLTHINPATITDVSHSSTFFLIYTALKWGFDFIGHL